MLYIILAMVLYSVAILFGAAASRNTNTNLAAAVTNIVSSLLPLLVAMPLFTRKNLTDQKFGVLMAVICGVFIAAYVMALNKAYSLNNVGVVAPVVFGGALFLSTILSYFVFKEKVSGLQLIGLIVLGAGLGLIIYARAAGK